MLSSSLSQFANIIRVLSNNSWFNRKAGALAMAAAIGLVLASIQVASPAESAAGTESTLSKLENKFFHFDYGKEPVEQRVERLEKMVFGEAKTGSPLERLNSLLTTVPSWDEAEEPVSGQAGLPIGTANQSKGNSQSSAQQEEVSPPSGSSNYPAVSAIEKRLFGKDYSGDAVGKRLDRLEKKVFGKESTSDDLSSRVDNLKKHTGIDIARQAPPGSDWTDEDWDDDMGFPVPQPRRTASQYQSAPSGEDGRSFSGVDHRRNLRRAFGMPPESGDDQAAGGGLGTFGMGGSSAGGSAGQAYSAPAVAPSYKQGIGSAPGTAPAMGLNQQVGALEKEIFGKNFARDSLPDRLRRLETTVFPEEKPAISDSLPARVKRLLAVIPLAPTPADPRPRVAGAGSSYGTGFDDADQVASGTSQSRPPGSGGLGKIINSISNFVSGGLSGGYPMNGLQTDPQTGLLYDARTGNLIDPYTGAVVGQRLAPGTGSGVGGYGSFNNGFAPYGAVPYGMGNGSGVRFGIGGGGVGGGGVGSPGMGRYGYGMWP